MPPVQAPNTAFDSVALDGGPVRATDESAVTAELETIDAGPPPAELLAAIEAAGGAAVSAQLYADALDAGPGPDE